MRSPESGVRAKCGVRSSSEVRGEISVRSAGCDVSHACEVALTQLPIECGCRGRRRRVATHRVADHCRRAADEAAGVGRGDDGGDDLVVDSAARSAPVRNAAPRDGEIEVQPALDASRVHSSRNANSSGPRALYDQRSADRGALVRASPTASIAAARSPVPPATNNTRDSATGVGRQKIRRASTETSVPGHRAARGGDPRPVPSIWTEQFEALVSAARYGALAIEYGRRTDPLGEPDDHRLARRKRECRPRRSSVRIRVRGVARTTLRAGTTNITRDVLSRTSGIVPSACCDARHRRRWGSEETEAGALRIDVGRLGAESPGPVVNGCPSVPVAACRRGRLRRVLSRYMRLSAVASSAS